MKKVAVLIENQYQRRHEKIDSFVRGIYDKGGVVAGICHGGRKATSFFAIKDGKAIIRLPGS